jgi:Fe-S oxidoreductase
VNVPEFRAKFLSHYYDRYQRPIKDYLVSSLEYLIPLWSKIPHVYNLLATSQVGASALKQFGVEDSPAISTYSLLKGMKKRNISFASTTLINNLTATQQDNSVIIVQDAFTSYFETQLVLDICDFLLHLGVNVYIAPFKPNGKPVHVHGFLDAFEKSAKQNARMLNQLAQSNIAFIGIDPSMTLTYRQEYKTAGVEAPNVQLLQEWLVNKLDNLNALSAKISATQEYRFLAHCTEKTSVATTHRQWQQIFASLGQNLKVQTVGCCGMAGTYGHESKNIENSKAIYDMSWKQVVNETQAKGELLATGYSCRSQVKRIDQQQLKHPIQALLQLVSF